MWLPFWGKDLTDSKTWAGHQIAGAAIQERRASNLIMRVQLGTVDRANRNLSTEV